MFDRLEALGCQPRRVGAKLIARCPAHDDRSPSLSVYLADAGRGVRPWWRCHAGCSWQAVAAALELAGPIPTTVGEAIEVAIPVGWCARPWLRVTDGRPLPGAARCAEERPASAGPWQHVASYPYEDASGRLLGVVDRHECSLADGRRAAKTFRPRLLVTDPDGRVSWRHRLDGAVLPLFRLPDLFARAEGAPIIAVEGEKDALTLAARGYAATTCAGGASAWKRQHTEQLLAASSLRGSPEPLILWADADVAGAAWRAKLLAALTPRRAVQVIDRSPAVAA